jgi:hypothetical protein
MTVATAKKAYGWYDAEQVEDGSLPKAACKFPHHEVDGDGTPGAANLAACRNGLARLPQSDVPEDQRAAVEAHLRAHLADGDSGGEDHTSGVPAAFDPGLFRAATAAALDPMPNYQPEHLRSLMAGIADDAPAAPQPQPPTPGALAPEVVYVPEPPPPAGQVVTDYLRAVMTGVANDAPAPPAAPAPEPSAPEPIPAIDRTVFERALWEGRL